MVGEVRIVKAEFLQENNISMAKDSTNPLNIEWFSYGNYDLDYASCGHKRSGFTKTCSHLYPFIPVKRTVKSEEKLLVSMDENMEKWRKRSGMKYLRCKSKESDLNMDFKAHLSKLESKQKVCCMVVCLNFDSLELNGRFI